jgi:tetratricopeptide (TPR) repeat protein
MSNLTTTLNKIKIKCTTGSRLSIFLLICFFVLTGTASAQTGKEKQLADQYLNSAEYDKAAAIYEKIYDQDPSGIYPNYLRTLISLRSYDKAQKMIKKMIKKNPDDYSFLVDLGYLYSVQGDMSQSKQQYEKAIKALKPDQQQIITLANSFVGRQEWDYALDTYLEGKKLMKGYYSFSFETAEIYFQKQNFGDMINEYLDALGENPAYIQNVQNILQARIGNDPENTKTDLLRTSLLRRIQKSSDQPIYSELLIWLFVQQKDFDSAFIQAKALDKRQKEDGGRIISLASLSVSNLHYDAAIKCYQYVIDKGPSNPYYVNARMELLNTLNRKITESNTYTQADLLKLESDYLSALNELGKNGQTASLIRGLSHLRVFYLDKPGAAMDELDSAISFPDISKQMQAECKLELGDILLFTGNVWDSDLLYAQVDKAFKNDPLGQEAKFRSARLDYYRGDFLWAQAQLDVLKSATSQLIANDALSLSLLISDHVDADSNNAPLMYYARADLLNYQNKNDLALQALDSLLILFPGHSLTDHVFYKEAKIMDVKRNFAMEDSLLSEIIEKFPEGILADDALFDRAALYESKLNNKDKAMQLYQDLLTKYPGSLYCVEARKKYRALRGDILN